MDVEAYSHIISMVERAHRLFLDLVKLELEDSGVPDINNVQALMLYNIGDSEMTVGELTLRGCHLGSNVSYNVKKMVENGYLADLRSIHVKLTDKGRMLRDSLSAIYQRHVRMIGQARITDIDLQRTTAVFDKLERFWIGAGRPYRWSPDAR
ncbi:MAG: winged helix-turn-helix transcriptional regulator [Alphaproteobacteria bacterium]|nr:MAG: winged helix-turn-helix transcriptional regulator [Alphaproteobacteria bacterium]